MLSTPSRRVSPVEEAFITAQLNVHIGIEFDTPSFVPTAAERLKERVMGLHLKCIDNHVMKTNDPITIDEIPRSCKSVGEAARWVIAHNMPKPEKRLATINVGESCVVMSMNHMIADGTLLRQLIDNIARDYKPVLPDLPIPADVTFAEDIKRLSGEPRYSGYTLIHPRNRDKIPKVRQVPVDTIEYRVPVNEMVCYNRSTDKVHGLTESLLNSLLLSAVAYNGKWTGKLASHLCVNLRQYLTKEQVRNPGICNHFSDITVDGTGTLDTPVGEFSKQFRAAISKRIKEKECLKNIGGLTSIPTDGLQFELSNVGKVTWQRPVKGVYFQVGFGKAGRPNTIDVFCHSMVQECFNNLEMKLAFPTDWMTWDEAHILGRSLSFGLRAISDKMTVREAVRALEDYQRILRKH